MPDDPYRAAIGRSRSELETPALVSTSTSRAEHRGDGRPHGAGRKDLRPHRRPTRPPDRASRSTPARSALDGHAWEAIAMIDAGSTTSSSPTRSSARADQGAAEAARDGRVPWPSTARRTSTPLGRCVAAGSVIGVLVEVDVGMNRGGVAPRRRRSTSPGTP
jgi:hypothetical protein